MVDDGNSDATQGQQLAKINKVKLVRNPIRQGLIRSRLAGVEAAQAEVLVFLDSHCEVGHTWIQPLLEALLADRTTIVSPIIDNINLNTFQVVIYLKKIRIKCFKPKSRVSSFFHSSFSPLSSPCGGL